MAPVFLLDLAQTYDGTARTVTATTMPAGLMVEITYDGGATAPSNAGTYAVTGTVNHVMYQGVSTGLLDVAKADQAITFPAIADQLATGEVGLSATADSGFVVAFAVGSGPASIAGGTNLTFSTSGTVSIVASQAEDADWNPAPEVTNTFNVTKDMATVYLLDLAQTYDGTARAVTATSMPTGLTVEFTYDGAASAPTNAGTYDVNGTVNDLMYQGVAADSLVVARALDTITFGDTNPVYDGTGKTATAVADSGSPVDLTYDGSASVPVNVGAYSATGVVDALNWEATKTTILTILKADQGIAFPAIGDQETTGEVGLAATADSGLVVSFAVEAGPATLAGGTNLTFTGAGSVSIVASQGGDTNWNAAPDATNTFNVTKAVAPVFLLDLAQTYDGTARTITATTMPAGLMVEITYDGGPAAPSNAGSYAITGLVNDVMYQGVSTGSLVVARALDTISFSDTNHVYDGTGKTATAVADSGSPVDLTYDGLASVPVNVGAYPVTGIVDALNWEATNTATLTIIKADQGIAFPAIANQETTNEVGLSATADSGLVVSFAVEAGPAMIAGGTNLTFTGEGSVSIVASQGGDTNWNAAPDATKAVATVFLLDLAQTYDGTARTVTATTMPAGLSVEITYDGLAPAPTAAGSYAVTGSLNNAIYQGTAVDSLVVSKAGQMIEVFLPTNGSAFAENEVVGLSAAASSGLAVSFATNGGPAVINGGTNLGFTAHGAVFVVAAQAGDGNWEAAPQVTNIYAVHGLPDVGPVTVWRPASNLLLKVEDMQLLTNAGDPEGTALAVVWVAPNSTNGGALTLSGHWIVYEAPASEVPDLFQFRVRNTYGAESLGTAEVLTFTPATEEQTLNISSVAPSSSNTMVRFVGIPGRLYNVQMTTNLLDAWQKVGEITIGGLGYVIFTNDSPPPASQYYRTAKPE